MRGCKMALQELFVLVRQCPWIRVYRFELEKGLLNRQVYTGTGTAEAESIHERLA